MATETKSLGKGANYGSLDFSLLIYADDIVFMAETEDDLQQILRTFETWCNKWQTNCNVAKTQIIHFCGECQTRTQFEFKLFNNVLQIVP